MNKIKFPIIIVAVLTTFIFVGCNNVSDVDVNPSSVGKSSENTSSQNPLDETNTHFLILYENDAMQGVTMTFKIKKSATEKEIDAEARDMIADHVEDATGEKLVLEDIEYSLLPVVNERDLLPSAPSGR